MYRFKPTYEIKAYPFEVYPAQCKQAQCVMHNVMNNLNHDVAQFPEELITYVRTLGYFLGWQWSSFSELGPVLLDYALSEYHDRGADTDSYFRASSGSVPIDT